MKSEHQGKKMRFVHKFFNAGGVISCKDLNILFYPKKKKKKNLNILSPTWPHHRMLVTPFYLFIYLFF